MKQLNDLFSVPEMCLISNVTEYFIQNNIPYYPEILYHDVTVILESTRIQFLNSNIATSKPECNRQHSSSDSQDDGREDNRQIFGEK